MTIPWQDFHFLRPEWFWALIPMAIIVGLLRHLSVRRSGWQGVIPVHLYHYMVSVREGKRSRPPLWLLGLAWLLAVTALAGPTWERLPQPVFQLKSGHVILMDMSLSMRATDVSPDRLTRAKYKAIDLIKEIGEGEIGLVAYSGDAFVISPLTSDGGNVTSLIPSLSPEIMPTEGSDPLLGMQQASELLTNAGYKKGTIYWVTDGIEPQLQAELVTAVGDMPFQLNILAVGTKDGAPIRQINGELLKRNNGSIVIPKTNTGALASLASAGGGQFASLTADDSDIRALAAFDFSSRRQAESEQSDSQSGDQWRELGPYLVLLILPFAAYAFRRGVVFSLLAGALMLPAPRPALAQQPQTEQPAVASEDAALPWWKSPFLNSDQTGKAQYDGQAYANAAATFDDPAWRGAAEYKAGNYQGALEAYTQLNTPDAYYNQGNALAQLGEYEKAITAYEQTLAAQPDNKMAAENKALIEELLKQQQEQEQQQNQQQQNQNNPSDDQQQNDQNQQGESSENNDKNESGDEGQQSDQQDQSGQSDDSQNGQESPRSADNEENQQDGSEQGRPEPQERDKSDEQKGQQQAAGQQDNQDNSDAQQGQPVGAELTDEEKEEQQNQNDHPAQDALRPGVHHIMQIGDGHMTALSQRQPGA